MISQPIQASRPTQEDYVARSLKHRPAPTHWRKVGFLRQPSHETALCQSPLTFDLFIEGLRGAIFVQSLFFLFFSSMNYWKQRLSQKRYARVDIFIKKCTHSCVSRRYWIKKAPYDRSIAKQLPLLQYILRGGTLISNEFADFFVCSPHSYKIWTRIAAYAK